MCHIRLLTASAVASLIAQVDSFEIALPAHDELGHDGWCAAAAAAAPPPTPRPPLLPPPPHLFNSHRPPPPAAAVAASCAAPSPRPLTSSPLPLPFLSSGDPASPASFRAIFIRAPAVLKAGAGVEVLAELPLPERFRAAHPEHQGKARRSVAINAPRGRGGEGHPRRLTAACACAGAVLCGDCVAERVK